MRRIAAAWRLRSRERAHGLPLLVVGIMVAATLSVALASDALVLGLVISAFWVSVWLWGLWDEGGRLVTRTYKARRRS